MDPGSLSVSVCLVMACLLGAAPLSNNTSCPCPRIPPLKLIEPPPEGCYQIEERYRYQCVEGYVRKAGTSALTRCRGDDHGHLRWITPSLECIRKIHLFIDIFLCTGTTTIQIHCLSNKIKSPPGYH
uniref:Sushi domain-containing protein n=1 Tax=Amphiprion ocellaris TaxID=80972 RepID=A0AAQ5X907_AMPOC